MLALLAIVILVLVLLSAGAPPLTFGALLFGALFIGFWVIVIRMLIGLGRWLIGEPPPRRFASTRIPPHRGPVSYRTSRRACADPRCGRVNVPEARFCAQCGRPLGGPVPIRPGLDTADERAA